MILQPPGERPTICTNVPAASTSLVKKDRLNNPVCQNKVGTPFDSEILLSSTQTTPQTAISSQGNSTPPVYGLRSLVRIDYI